MKIETLSALLALTLVSHGSASASVTLAPGYTIVSSTAEIWLYQDDIASDNSIALGPLPSMAMFNSDLTSLGITATADTFVENTWSNETGRYDIAMRLDASLNRTGLHEYFMVARAYASFSGRLSVSVSETATVRLEGAALGSGAGYTEFRLQRILLDDDPNTPLYEGVSSHILEVGDTLIAEVTLPPGEYVLWTQQYLGRSAYIMEDQLGFTDWAEFTASLTVIPAPGAAALLAPLAMTAMRRRR